MNKSKFTPGPWEHDVAGGNVFADDMKMNVCDIRGFGYLTSRNCANLTCPEAIEVQKANAALIAVAPEMYEHIKKALNSRIDDEWLKDAEELLKKARGES